MDAGLDEYLARLQRVGYVPRRLADGTPCSVVERGAGSGRVFVISIPKAGTYLAAEVLAALGLRSALLHVDEGWASDFREYRKGTPMWKYQFEMPVEDALRLVQPGQFAVGHLPAGDGMRQALAGFRRIFIFRDLRHAFVSWARFVIAQQMDAKAAEAARTIPDGPARVLWVLTRPSSAWLVPTCREMIAWRHDADVLPLRFEDLVGDNGAGAQSDAVAGIVAHLGLDIAVADAVTAARGCVGNDTLTFSGARSLLASHWDERVEAWFAAAGGPELNAELGYPPAG